jgi:DNA modification methylase
MINKIYNKDSRIKLKKIPDESVQLVYLDPPFYSNRNYERTYENKVHSFTDIWENGLEEYINFMKVILLESHRILSRNGSLYLHCDAHISHYLKVETDKIFGYNRFRNEIIWKRHNAHNDTKQGAKKLGKIHDTILHYTKSAKYIWNPIYQPYSEKFLKKYYKYVEPQTERLYALGDLSGPGGRSKGNPFYEFLGVSNYWRYSKENMIKLLNTNRIVQRNKGKMPMVKRYLDEMPGIILQDIWDDIQSEQISNKSAIVYPTQKPLRLLERIIEISTNPKDMIIDPFCGSGTSLLAARNLGRKFIGIDINKNACIISRKRLQKSRMVDRNVPKIKFEIQRNYPFIQLTQIGSIVPMIPIKVAKQNIFVNPAY